MQHHRIQLKYFSVTLDELTAGHPRRKIANKSFANAGATILSVTSKSNVLSTKKEAFGKNQ